jgi:hypothetical protein
MKKKECICSNYDKKGVSTCGVKCPIHTEKKVRIEIKKLSTYKCGLCKQPIILKNMEEINNKINEIIRVLNNL